MTRDIFQRDPRNVFLLIAVIIAITMTIAAAVLQRRVTQMGPELAVCRWHIEQHAEQHMSSTPPPTPLTDGHKAR